MQNDSQEWLEKGAMYLNMASDSLFEPRDEETWLTILTNYMQEYQLYLAILKDEQGMCQ